MPETVEIGLGRTVRRGYHLDELALIPSRRTRAATGVSTTWQIDAHTFDIPLVAAPSDAVVSPTSALEIERLGGLAVLDGEGLWTRHEDAAAWLGDIYPGDTVGLRQAYSAPVSPELLRRRIAELRGSGVRVAVRLSPQNTVALAPHVLAEGVDLLVIQGTVISAEHVISRDENSALNLKTFLAGIDVPVIVGGCADYQTALHLMRTGAAGVIVGYGAHAGSTTHLALGIDVPMATAIVDAAAARRDYLDETGGRYVHLIAYGDLATGGDIAKALACGADAVMLGSALAVAAESPGGGRYWDSTAAHRRVPRSTIVQAVGPRKEGFDLADGADVGGFDVDPSGRPSLQEVLHGPAQDASGECNLFGSVRRAMAKCGYSSVKEFQKAGLTLHSGR